MKTDFDRVKAVNQFDPEPDSNFRFLGQHGARALKDFGKLPEKSVNILKYRI